MPDYIWTSATTISLTKRFLARLDLCSNRHNLKQIFMIPWSLLEYHPSHKTAVWLRYVFLWVENRWKLPCGLFHRAAIHDPTLGSFKSIDHCHPCTFALESSSRLFNPINMGIDTGTEFTIQSYFEKINYRCRTQLMYSTPILCYFVSKFNHSFVLACRNCNYDIMLSQKQKK